MNAGNDFPYTDQMFRSSVAVNKFPFRNVDNSCGCILFQESEEQGFLLFLPCFAEITTMWCLWYVLMFLWLNFMSFKFSFDVLKSCSDFICQFWNTFKGYWHQGLFSYSLPEY